MREDKIIEQIKNFILRDPPSSYYVGVTHEPKIRLQAHSALHAKAMSVEADDIESARRIEKYFIIVIGTDGGTGSGDENSKHIYCYKKDFSTVERT